jgi:hypothetical protein
MEKLITRGHEHVIEAVAFAPETSYKNIEILTGQPVILFNEMTNQFNINFKN